MPRFKFLIRQVTLLAMKLATATGTPPRERSWRLTLIGLLIAAIGCSRPVARQDERELRHPKIRAAIALEKAGNEAGAIRLYQEALAQSPNLARAHLNLAFLLEKPQHDPLMAVFHYQQYLALRPRTEKKAIIEDRIRAAREAAIANMLPADHIYKQLEVLQEENHRLRAANSNLIAQLKALENRPTGDRLTGPGASPDLLSGLAIPVPPPAPGQRMHTVRPGETLSGIAAQYYGDSRRWRDIVTANPHTLRNPQDLKVGQTLLIP